MNSITLFLTNKCNLHCDYCIVNIWNKSINENNFSCLYNFLSKNIKKIDTIKFLWWEPLIEYNKIKKIANISKNINFELATNWYFINKEIADFLKEKNFKVNLSLDFQNKNYTEKSEYFKGYKDFYFSLTLTPENLDNAYEFVKGFYKKWFRNYNILPVFYNNLWTDSDIEKLKLLYKKLLSLKIGYKELFFEWVNDGDEKLLNYDKIFINYDWEIFLSDVVENYIGIWWDLKDSAKIWNIKDVENIDSLNKIIKEKEYLIDSYLKSFEEKEKKLFDVVDYFSTYYNKISKYY